MSLVSGISSPHLGAFVGGLFYGSVFRTASCLSRVASHIAGAGSHKGIVTVAYNSGRVAAYASIGDAVGFLSNVFKTFLSEASLLPFQERFSTPLTTVMER
jgi:sulfite exporter TauE/SafE